MRPRENVNELNAADFAAIRLLTNKTLLPIISLKKRIREAETSVEGLTYSGGNAKRGHSHE